MATIILPWLLKRGSGVVYRSNPPILGDLGSCCTCWLEYLCKKLYPMNNHPIFDLALKRTWFKTERRYGRVIVCRIGQEQQTFMSSLVCSFRGLHYENYSVDHIYGNNVWRITHK